jgi:hypothetical protein
MVKTAPAVSAVLVARTPVFGVRGSSLTKNHKSHEEESTLGPGRVNLRKSRRPQKRRSALRPSTTTLNPARSLNSSPSFANRNARYLRASPFLGNKGLN